MFEIDGHMIGTGHPVLVIAEAGVNHNGDIDLAHRLIDAAAVAGADAVKFQTFRVDDLITRDAPKAAYQAAQTGAGESQRDMLAALQLSADAHPALIDHCRERGVTFLSTPFEERSADLLESLGVAAFKVPSGETTNLPLLRHIARKGRPILLSTGMSTLGEVDAAVAEIAAAGNPPLVLLHCLSAYPADPREVNLRAIPLLASAFGVPAGYSDHTPGIAVALAAVALGAVVVEKHMTLDHTLPGPDHQASLEPDELASLIAGIRTVETCLGDGRKIPQPGEANTATVVRKSIVAISDIPAGAVIAASDVGMRRPGTGMPARLLGEVIGRRAARRIVADTVLDAGDME